MSAIDVLFLLAMIATWLLLIANIILLFYGYGFAEALAKEPKEKYLALKAYPFVSIMIPAHNEGIVIGRTLEAMVRLDYPKDRYEVIVINDNSSDNTGDVIEQVILDAPNTRIVHLQTFPPDGGKGKSAALNAGFKVATGELIAIYDADNTPNAMALRYLVATLQSQDDYGAVIGKFRTRNKTKNLLTKFINIETLSFQWMAQAGRWRLFKLCTIPGTNFIIRRSIIEAIGGWDPKAIAEDTEISFRVYQMGYKIAFMPLAETFEQEPETIRVWMKQRARWVNGNLYVLFKNITHFKEIRNHSIWFDLFYYFSVYVLFLSAIVISDLIFLIGVFTNYDIQISGNYIVIWILSYMVFLLQVAVTLSIEKGETNRENLLLVSIMYFTYCQLWLIVSLKGLGQFIKATVLKQGTKWYKTERF